MMENNDMIVCQCKKVDVATIRKAIIEGARTVEELMEKTGAGTGCGGCIPELEKMLKVICTCKNVTYEEIIGAVQDGANSVDAVATATGAGTCCRKCRPVIQNIADF